MKWYFSLIRLKMSQIANYNEVSKSYDSTRGATEAYIVKSMMENFTGKTVKVTSHRVHGRINVTI